MEVTKEYEFLKDTIIESSNDTGENNNVFQALDNARIANWFPFDVRETVNMDDNKDQVDIFWLFFEKEVLVSQMRPNFKRSTDFKHSVMESGMYTFSCNERTLTLFSSVSEQ